MKQSTSNALVGIGLGFLLFLMYVLVSGCYVEKVNVYNAPTDDNRTSQLIKPAGKADGKKGIGLDQS